MCKDLVSTEIDYPAWIGAIAAIIGVPLSLVSIIKLVSKDKDREAQIGKLATIAIVLEAQTQAMLEQNQLLAQQVDIFRNTGLLHAQDGEAVAKLQAIEEQKLRLSVQPRLWLNGAGYRSNGELHIDLNNKGEVAYLDEINLISGNVTLHSKSLPYELEKGERRNIYGRANDDSHIKDAVYMIELLYHNSIKQNYRAVIEGHGATAKIISDDPLD
ncbi:hypothetical protein [Mucilaginibacter pedocola]|uniref:Uncharacterized protein n=1 Tax=Mucilaginibacter pedocola TaxID=1792845 RepID=A0A1S9PK74_9SPHI|nr:hypothetical protein [Mucilaginibacter pedocola]OOQ61351.1 hypothetical protein BC343_20440 [Mucilaginibacter pedocola]